MGILSFLATGHYKDNPFQSESLDNLAELMQVSPILKRDKSKRYYKVPFLPAGGLSFVDRVFFDAKYLEMLLPEELRALGAHEFTHIKEKHGKNGFREYSSLQLPLQLLSDL